MSGKLFLTFCKLNQIQSGHNSVAGEIALTLRPSDISCCLGVADGKYEGFNISHTIL